MFKVFRSSDSGSWNPTKLHVRRVAEERRIKRTVRRDVSIGLRKIGAQVAGYRIGKN